MSNLKTITYPNGEKVSYTYDAANQLVAVTDYKNRKTSYQYDKNGRLVRTERPDGSVETVGYDKAGRMIAKTDTIGGTVINAYTYRYDANGNITQESETTYAYDKNERVTAKNLTDSFAYDAGGNMTVSNADSFTYGKGNRLTGYNGETLTYDADGNMTYGPLENKFASFRFDALNRLVKAGDTVYTYDGENNRVSDGKTTYVNDLNSGLSNLLMTVNPDYSATLYVYGNGLISQETGADYKLFHYDYRGSTTALTNISGTVTDTYTYSVYGAIESHTGDTRCIFLYVGQYGVQTDSNGLYYMRARYYSAVLGRFINEDPIRDGLNWYGYCNGNPIRFSDPSGLVAVDAVEYAKTYSGAKVIYSGNNSTKDGIWIRYDGNEIFLSFYTDRVDGKYICDDSLFVNTFGIGTDSKLVYLDATTGNVSIRAAFWFTGDTSMTIGGTSAKSLFLTGIETTWSGVFGSYEVSAYAREASKGTKVVLRDKSGISNVNLFGTVTMYSGDSRSTGAYSQSDFQWVASHEFGHVMKLPDLYNTWTGKPKPGVTSIMNAFGTGVQELDITNLLKKWKKIK